VAKPIGAPSIIGIGIVFAALHDQPKMKPRSRCEDRTAEGVREAQFLAARLVPAIYQ
jgi:hypothetical protein